MPKIKLTYPERSHQIEDLRPLYEEFKTVHADVFDYWRKRELSGDITLDNNLNEVAVCVEEFLKSRVEWHSNAALIGAFADFRRLMGKDLFAN